MAANSYSADEIRRLRELADAYTLGDDLLPSGMHDICMAFLALSDGPKERLVAERCAVIVEESASYWLNEQHGARPEYLEAAKDAERICRGDAARMRALDGLDATQQPTEDK